MSVPDPVASKVEPDCLVHTAALPAPEYEDQESMFNDVTYIHREDHKTQEHSHKQAEEDVQ